MNLKKETFVVKSFTQVISLVKSLRSMLTHHHIPYPTEVPHCHYEKVSRYYLEGGRGLMPSPGQITNAMLLQEALQGAPSEHTHEFLHLKKPLILS